MTTPPTWTVTAEIQTTNRQAANTIRRSLAATLDDKVTRVLDEDGHEPDVITSSRIGLHLVFPPTDTAVPGTCPCGCGGRRVTVLGAQELPDELRTQLLDALRTHLGDQAAEEPEGQGCTDPACGLCHPVDERVQEAGSEDDAAAIDEPAAATA